MLYHPVLNVASIHPSIYGATAPSGPWPPSQDASIQMLRHPVLNVASPVLNVASPCTKCCVTCTKCCVTCTKCCVTLY